MKGFPLTFGKHKGQDIDEIPTKYLVWLSDKLKETGTYGEVNKLIIAEAEKELKYRKKHDIP